MTRLTYPSGRAININHDSSGRLSSLTEPVQGSPVPTYLSNVTFNVAGQITSWRLGDPQLPANYVTETFGYDTQRQQLTSQTAVRNGATLMSLSYNYQATTGQMGPGTTAGNADQLMSVSGSINGATESASYTYDLWRRLATSSQTTQGASVQRRFAYDRWGNRTGVWDAVTGGNQIQSVTLQGGGVPTNRIASVTNYGSPVSYSYDANGNVTWDGLHSYNYDAENRLTRVDGGSTAAYAFDHANRRIKAIASGASIHYVWEGSKVLAEHNATTGAQLTDYIYARGRMIAKGSGTGATTINYMLRDRLSTRLVVNYAGTVQGWQGHLPFGEEVGFAGTQEKHRFTSYERDTESGTDHAVNRQYSSAVGRYMNPDPVPSGSPQGLNRYVYVVNDPVNSTDRLGLFPTSFFASVAFMLWNGYMLIQGFDSIGGGSGGSGRRDALLDTGTEEVPSGPGQGFDPTIDPRPLLKKFFKDHPGCKDFFTSMDDPSFSDGFYGWINSIAEGASWDRLSQFPNLQTLSWREAFGPNPPVPPGSKPDNIIGVDLGTGPNRLGEALAMPNIKGTGHHVVLLGLTWEGLTDAQRSLIVVHESLHLAFWHPANPNSASHSEIVNALEKAGADISTTTDAAHALDAWLSAGCPKKAKK